MSLATADIHVKIDPQVKRDSEKVLKEIGISMSDLINITLRKLIREKRVDAEASTVETIPANLRIDTKDQLVGLLNERENVDSAKYTSAEMRNMLSERLGLDYDII